MRIALLVIAIILSGCFAVATDPASESKAPPGMAADTPTMGGPAAPRDASAGPGGETANGVEGNATAPAPASLEWRKQCNDAWLAGAIEYDNPPWVAGVPCLFKDTEDGSIYYLWRPGADAKIKAAPVARSDGFFDWVYYENGAIYYGSFTGFITELGPAPGLSERVVVSAAWLGDELHFVQASEFSDVKTIHAWWSEEDGLEYEEIDGVWSLGDPSRLRSDGTTLVLQSPRLGLSYLYTTNGGKFTQHAVQGSLFSVAIAGQEIWGCYSLAGAYHAIHGTMSEAGWVFTTQPVAPGLFADLAFACGVGISNGTPTMIFDSPAAIGNGPNPTGGSIAATKNGPAWDLQEIGFVFHSGADVTTVKDQIIHLGETANGTPSRDEQDGTELRKPIEETNGPWHKFWGNFGRTTYLVDDQERLLILGEMWANRPFNYGQGSAGELSWAVVEVPLEKDGEN